MAKPTVAIIGVPLDLGAGRRGVDMGPSAFRVAELDARIAELGYEVKDLGDLRVAIAETQAAGDPHLKYLKEIKDVCETLRDRVDEARRKGQRAARPGRRPFDRHGHHRRPGQVPP